MRLDLLGWSLYLTAMIVESSWLYALIETINRKATEGRLSVALLLVLLPVSLLANRLVQRVRWPRTLQLWLGWVIWLPCMLIMVKLQFYQATPWGDPAWLSAVPSAIVGLLYGFPPEILILLSSPLIWWFGQRLASQRPDFGFAVGDFQFGLVMIVITFLITAGIEMEFELAVPIIMVFFGFGLLGMSIAHARENTGWLASVYRGPWSGVVVISIVVILVLGFITGVIFAPGLAQAILAAARWAWGWFEKLLTYLASLIPPPDTSASPLPGASPVPGEPEPRVLFEIPENARRILQIAWTVLFFGMFGLALWRLSSSVLGWLRRVLATSGAEVEPMSGAFRADLLSLFKALLALIWRKLRWPGRQRRAISPEASSVRQVYQQVLRWAATLGYPRALSQTPYEYLSATLAAHIPGQEAGLTLITDRYVRARYGAAPVSDDDLREVRDAWSRLKEYRRRRKREAK